MKPEQVCFTGIQIRKHLGACDINCSKEKKTQIQQCHTPQRHPTDNNGSPAVPRYDVTL